MEDSCCSDLNLPAQLLLYSSIVLKNIKTLLPGRLLFVVVSAAVIYLGISTVKVISKNWQLQQEIATLRGEVEVLQAENERLSYDIQYYKTDEYMEQAARQKLNLKAPGETVTIVGDINQPKARSGTGVFATETTPKKSNWQSWIDFLLGRD